MNIDELRPLLRIPSRNDTKAILEKRGISPLDIPKLRSLALEFEQAKKAWECIAVCQAIFAVAGREGFAKQLCGAIGTKLAQVGFDLEQKGLHREALPWLVRGAELQVHDPAIRQAIERIAADLYPTDDTRVCYIYSEPERGKIIYREALTRAVEYVSMSGLAGDILEFGTLAGFTARIFAENLRELMVPADLYLFDSFEGLPSYDSAVDRDSWDAGQRRIWDGQMKFDADNLKRLGGTVESHIHSRLSTVLSAERIKIVKGYYSQTLKEAPKTKAAIVHLDCDLYQSTIEVLEGLKEKDIFQDGCVLLFDDYNCNKASPSQGERLALTEFLQGNAEYSVYPWFTYGVNGAAFFLHLRPASERASSIGNPRIKIPTRSYPSLKQKLSQAPMAQIFKNFLGSLFVAAHWRTYFRHFEETFARQQHEIGILRSELERITAEMDLASRRNASGLRQESTVPAQEKPH